MDDREWTGPLALGIVEVPDEPPADLFRANLMLPCPTGEPNGIALEERDGESVLRYESTSLRLTVGRETSHGWKWEESVRLDKGEISVYVTAARVAFACSRYDRGGSFRVIGIPDVSDLVVLPIMTLGSKALAARRRRGKMLVGQFRYQWLKEICFKPPDRRGRSNLLVDGLSREGEHYAVSLTLRGAVGADQIAAEIVRRYAAYLLSLEPKWEEARLERLRQLAEIDHLPSDHRVGVFKDGVRYSFHETPVCFYMAPSTASWMPPSLAEPGEDADAEADAGVSDVLAVIELARRVEIGEAEVADLAPALSALASAGQSEIEAIAPRIAWFAALLSQQIPRDRREAAATEVMARVRQIADEVLPSGAALISPEIAHDLARLIRVWFVSALTQDERLEFLWRYWEDEPLADERRGVYVVALVVGAAAISACGDRALGGESGSASLRA